MFILKNCENCYRCIHHCPKTALSLSYSNCCVGLSEGATWKTIEEIFRSRYKGLFNRGFSEKEFADEVDADIVKYKYLFINCLNNNNLMQFNAIGDEVLEQKIREIKATDYSQKLFNFFEKTTMSVDEVKTVLISINPSMASLLNIWKEERGGLKVLSPTSVGYAIAVINFNAKTNQNNIIFK